MGAGVVERAVGEAETVTVQDLITAMDGYSEVLLVLVSVGVLLGILDFVVGSFARLGDRYGQ
ncbi:MAG: hypothetical protein Q8N28_03490 [bacterium]|nr:hypothetical protein [bacterium]